MITKSQAQMVEFFTAAAAVCLFLAITVLFILVPFPGDHSKPKLSVGDCFVVKYTDSESWEVELAAVKKVVQVGDKNYQAARRYNDNWHLDNSILDSVSFNLNLAKVDCPN